MMSEFTVDFSGTTSIKTENTNNLNLEVRDVKKLYKIGNEIGSGSYSVVKYAKHAKKNYPVAIKIIDKKTLNNK